MTILHSSALISSSNFSETRRQIKALESIESFRPQHYEHQSSLLLRRLRRQASTNTGQATTANSAKAGSTSDDGAGQPDSSANEQAETPELLSSLRCDFGSADALDLCKFKILDSPPNQMSHTNGWTLGSGRTALFQGGPLLDSSGLQAGSNETNGGYIFFETSNSFTPVASNNSTQAAQPMIGLDGYFGSSSAGANHHQQRPSATMGAYLMGHDQVITSQRVSVATPQASTQATAATAAAAGQHQMYTEPSFMSPNLTAPGPEGMCLSFQYAIQGLSADELRISLSDLKTGRSRQIWSSSESAGSNWTKGEVLYSVTNQHALVFSAVKSSGIIKDMHQRKFRGHLALDDIDIRKHDPLGGEQSACKGHCNFDGDLCGWTNGENNQEDDFDWSFGRGSDNLFTGPARDFISSSNNELTGSFLYTDSGYPRRPGDRALLISPMFQPTALNDAMCMRFAVHMFGSGIGSLAIKIRYADEGALNEPAPAVEAGASGANTAAGSSSTSSGAGSGQNGANQFNSSPRSFSNGKASNDLVVWEMAGDAGNSWHQGQTSVSSAKSPFQVLIEGVIGDNHLGNIAIDEISFSQGPCPTSPPVASKNYGDCTFEHSMCYWRNPDTDIHLDDLDWIRQSEETSIHGPNFDHTLKKRSGSYLKLENTFREPKSGTRAFLLSPVFQPKASGSVQCLSFYYYMFMRSISSSGPNLGTIRVYLATNNELVPIWRLTNPISSPNWKHARASLSTSMIDGQPQAPTKLFQIAFEGIWGDAASGAIALDDIAVFDGACNIMPAEARSVPGECTFDVDMCSWSNKTASYEIGPIGGTLSSESGSTMMTANDVTILDSSRSPFLQSVGSIGGSSLSNTPNHQHNSRLRTLSGWQLATVDSRPVNLQDHTYRAPIGYAYVDVLDSGSGSSSMPPLAYSLQSFEVAVQEGQQLVQCLSFWFAAYGRQDTNQLSVYLTQASAPPIAVDENAGANNQAGAQPAANGNRNSIATSSNSNNNNIGPSTAGVSADATSEAEQAKAWKIINGKQLWSITLRNVTESHRRKWLYGQVTIRADSNHIVRFVAISKDGGFALDDVSYFDGACETRPNHARVQSAEDEAADQAPNSAISATGTFSGPARGGSNSAGTGGSAPATGSNSRPDGGQRNN